MSRLFPLLLIGSLLLPAAARAAEAPASDELASDPVIQLYLKFKSSTARLPGLRADGAQGSRGTWDLAGVLPPLGNRPRGSRVWCGSVLVE